MLFEQLLAELANYRLPDGSITQDSVIALGLAVTYADRASASGSTGAINRELFYQLNTGSLAPPPAWLDRQKVATDGPSYGLVAIVRDVDDPRELSRYQADALDGQLEEMLAEGWRVEDPAALDKLGYRLDDDGKLIALSA